jgi:TetR/AcrR family transcriptional repressor of lmrAB and yxaGH operons
MSTNSAKTPTADPTPTRDRLIAAMRDALQRKGFHGVGLSELLANANAPKGVLYHHFPGGKAELAVVTINAIVVQLTAGLQHISHKATNPLQALTVWMGSAQKSLADSGYEKGCPLAAIALESTPNDTAIREALAAGFVAIRSQLAATLTNAGIEAAKSRQLAALIVSAYEGALVQARVAGSVDAMRDTADALMDLVRMHLPKPPKATNTTRVALP